MDYPTAYAKYKGYMSQIAIRTSNWDNLNDKKDVMQELSIVLWRCLDRYSDKDDKSFDKIIKSAFHNKIGNLLKSQRIERTGVVSIDSKDPKGNKFSDGMVKHIMTDKDYRDGINEVLGALTPESAMKAMDSLNTENRGKFIKGTRKAFGEVQNYFKKD